MRTAKVLAAQTLKIASMNGLAELDRLETELEDEISWENRAPPREVFGRVRKKADDILHSKPMLLVIVMLNVIDCLLVLGQVTVDFHYTIQSQLLKDSASDYFINEMHSQHPDHVLEGKSLYNLYDKILDATFIAWNTSSLDQGRQLLCQTLSSNSSDNSSSQLTSQPNLLSRHKRAAAPVVKDYSARWQIDTDYSKLIMVEVSHALHLASVTILSILMLETLLKILATVPRFFRHKLEVFDAFVVVVSFIIDLVFIEGIITMQLGKFVLIVTLLLPWRIIRVVNSLVVAVMDKQRFQLKLLYKQKKKVDKSLSEGNKKLACLQKQLDILKDLCQSRGVQEWEMKKLLGEAEPKANSTLKALGKLAFQAADAFTPLPVINGNAKMPARRKHSTSTPNLMASVSDDLDKHHINKESSVSRL